MNKKSSKEITLIQLLTFFLKSWKFLFLGTFSVFTILLILFLLKPSVYRISTEISLDRYIKTISEYIYKENQYFQKYKRDDKTVLLRRINTHFPELMLYSDDGAKFFTYGFFHEKDFRKYFEPINQKLDFNKFLKKQNINKNKMQVKLFKVRAKKTDVYYITGANKQRKIETVEFYAEGNSEDILRKEFLILKKYFKEMFLVKTMEHIYGNIPSFNLRIIDSIQFKINSTIERVTYLNFKLKILNKIKLEKQGDFITFIPKEEKNLFFLPKEQQISGINISLKMMNYNLIKLKKELDILNEYNAIIYKIKGPGLEYLENTLRTVKNEELKVRISALIKLQKKINEILVIKDGKIGKNRVKIISTLFVFILIPFLFFILFSAIIQWWKKNKEAFFSNFK